MDDNTDLDTQLIVRYKHLLLNTGSIYNVYWMISSHLENSKLSYFITASHINVYLLHKQVSLGLSKMTSSSTYSIWGLYNNLIDPLDRYSWIMIRPTQLGIGFSRTMLALELSYSHHVSPRLYVGLILLHPLLLQLSVCYQLMLLDSTYQYEYTWRSSLGGVC